MMPDHEDASLSRDGSTEHPPRIPRATPEMSGDFSSLLDDSTLGMTPPNDDDRPAEPAASTGSAPVDATSGATRATSSAAESEVDQAAPQPNGSDFEGAGFDSMGDGSFDFDRSAMDEQASATTRGTTFGTFLGWMARLQPFRERSAGIEPRFPNEAAYYRGMWIERPAPPTKLGNRTLALLCPLIAQRSALPSALFELSAARLPGPTGRFIDLLARDVHDGVDLARLLKCHRRVFGDLAAFFVVAGEDTVGAREALIRYVRHRRELQSIGRGGLHDGIGAQARSFALTFSALSELGGNIDFCISGSALEMPRRLRARLRTSWKSVRGGASIAEALPKRGVLAPGFEHRFIAMVEAGDRLSTLPSLLRDVALG